MSDDQLNAQRLLRVRSNRASVSYFYKANFRRNLLIASVLALGMMLAAVANAWTLFFLYLGIMAGVFLRDYSWFRAVNKSYPFTEKVTDWALVQKLADGE